MSIAKLDANESPYDLPEAIKEQVLERARELPFNRYETPYLGRLKSLLAGQGGVTEDRVVLGNGSDELIQLLCLAWGGPETAVVYPSPTFSVYRFAAAQARCPARPIPLSGPAFELDTTAVLEELEKWPRGMIFVCRPNNPTGNTFPRPALRRLLEAAPGLVVVDEAYVEFAGDSLADWLDVYPNLVILRTLSKAYRLAGLRLGYLLGDAGVTSVLEETRMPYNVGVFSQLAAATVLENREQILAAARQLTRQRRQLAEALSRIPQLQVYPSHTNFLLVETPVPAPELQEQLYRNGVAVRAFPGERGLERCLRISVGTPEENELVYGTLAALLPKGG